MNVTFTNSPAAADLTLCGCLISDAGFVKVSGNTRRLHLSADGSCVGVEIRRPSSLSVPQQGASDGRQRHRQRLVVVVRGHVGDPLPAVAHLIGSADVEGRVVGRAAGAVAALPPSRFGGVGGLGQLWRRQRHWGGDWSVQTSEAAGVAGEVLLRDGATVRAIILTAVVLQRQRFELMTFKTKIKKVGTLGKM